MMLSALAMKVASLVSRASSLEAWTASTLSRYSVESPGRLTRSRKLVLGELLLPWHVSGKLQKVKQANAWLARSQYDAARDGAVAQFGHGLIDSRQGARCYLRVNFSGGGHGEHRAEFLARPYRRSLDADF